LHENVSFWLRNQVAVFKALNSLSAVDLGNLFNADRGVVATGSQHIPAGNFQERRGRPRNSFLASIADRGSMLLLPTPQYVLIPSFRRKVMSRIVSRRSFVAVSAGVLSTSAALADEDDAQQNVGPREAPFERDYPVPGFKPSWKKPQINRSLVQDFVIYAHSDADMTSKLLDKNPSLVNATIDWGDGDWGNRAGRRLAHGTPRHR
jgi:hypothetical protein